MHIYVDSHDRNVRICTSFSTKSGERVSPDSVYLSIKSDEMVVHGPFKAIKGDEFGSYLFVWCTDSIDGCYEVEWEIKNNGVMSKHSDFLYLDRGRKSECSGDPKLLCEESNLCSAFESSTQYSHTLYVTDGNEYVDAFCVKWRVMKDGKEVTSFTEAIKNGVGKYGTGPVSFVDTGVYIIQWAVSPSASLPVQIVCKSFIIRKSDGDCGVQETTSTVVRAGTSVVSSCGSCKF